MKGKVGTATVTHRLKKPNKIACDCSRCKHSTSRHGFLYCSWFDLTNPKRTSSVRYWEVKPPKKTKKTGKKPGKRQPTAKS